MTDALVKLPSRSRPALFRQRLLEYLADPIVTILVTADLDDQSMNSPVMRDFLARDRVTVRWGECKSKVAACNDGLNEHPWDGICILASDDMAVQRPDYASRIAELFEQHFPDGDGVLHLNDGRVGRSLNTLSILDRKFFDRTGWIYNPCFASVFCDDEFQAVSEKLGRAVYVNEVIIKHEWIGQYAPDQLHARNESRWRDDERTFRARKAAGFPR